jgi:hypothetical protein
MKPYTSSDLVTTVTIYIVQSVILWIRHIMALLCTTVYTWSRVCSSLVSARSSCVHVVYSERKSLLCRVVVCEQQKLRMWQFEQQENVKFCQKLGKSTSETFQMIKQVYDKEALGCSAVFKWQKRFCTREREFGR